MVIRGGKWLVGKGLSSRRKKGAAGLWFTTGLWIAKDYALASGCWICMSAGISVYSMAGDCMLSDGFLWLKHRRQVIHKIKVE